MKRFTLIILSAIVSNLAFSQPAKVITAKIQYDAKDYANAMKSIDQAVIHMDSKGDVKAWKIRGDVYGMYIQSKDLVIRIQRKIIYKRIEESYAKVKKLEPNGSIMKKVKVQARRYGNYALNDGVEKFNKKEYAEAHSLFALSIDLGEIADYTDTLAIYNMALVSERMEDYAGAIKYYQKCLDLNFKVERTYEYIVFAYRQLGDTENEGRTINEALSKFPNSNSLHISALNIMLNKGDNEGARKHIEKLVVLDPSNAQLHFTQGTICDNLQMPEASVRAYKKAIEVDPTFFNAHFNLAVMYFNKAVAINGIANDIDDDLERDKKLKEMDLEFYRSKESFEKALKIKPEDRSTLSSLKTIYERSGETEKLEEVKARLGN